MKLRKVIDVYAIKAKMPHPSNGFFDRSDTTTFHFLSKEEADSFAKLFVMTVYMWRSIEPAVIDENDEVILLKKVTDLNANPKKEKDRIEYRFEDELEQAIESNNKCVLLVNLRSQGINSEYYELAEQAVSYSKFLYVDGKERFFVECGEKVTPPSPELIAHQKRYHELKREGQDLEGELRQLESKKTQKNPFELKVRY